MGRGERCKTGSSYLLNHFNCKKGEEHVEKKSYRVKC